MIGRLVINVGKNKLETEYINDKDEPRMLSKFEEESLKDWYWKELDTDGDKSEIEYNEWKEVINWLEIDEIISHYTKENE